MGGPRYGSELAAEFEALWREVVIAQTTEAAKDAIAMALATIVARTEEAAATSRRVATELDSRIAAIAQLDSRVVKLLERERAQGLALDDSLTSVGRLSADIASAEAALARLKGYDDAVERIADKFTLLESKLARQTLAEDIAKVIAEDRDNDEAPGISLEKVSRIVEVARPADEGKSGALDKRPLAKQLAAALAGRGLALIAGVVVGLLAGAALGFWLGRAQPLVPDPRTSLAKPIAAAVPAVAINAGWRALSRADRRNEIATFCPPGDCDNFATVWDRPEFVGGQQRADLFAAIFRDARSEFASIAETCPKLLEGLDEAPPFADLPRPWLALAGHCLIREDFRIAGRSVFTEVARPLAMAYLARLGEERPARAQASASASEPTVVPDREPSAAVSEER